VRRLVPAGSSTTISLRSVLNAVPSQLPFDLGEVFIQLRPPGGEELLCARIPAGDFAAVAGGFDFRDPRGSLENARGIDRIVGRVGTDTTRAGTFGKRAEFVVPPPGAIDVTLGFFPPHSPPPSEASVSQPMEQSVAISACTSSPTNRILVFTTGSLRMWLCATVFSDPAA
jgi:hypothetical protein